MRGCCNLQAVSQILMQFITVVAAGRAHQPDSVAMQGRSHCTAIDVPVQLVEGGVDFAGLRAGGMFVADYFSKLICFSDMKTLLVR